MPELEILANNVLGLRLDINQTQADFAASTGISEEELSLIERQKTDPKLSTLQSLAAYSGWTVAELLQHNERYDEIANKRHGKIK